MRYTLANVQQVATTLTEWADQAQSSLDTAEDAEYPNDERIDMLTERLQYLEEAKDALESIEG